MDSLDRKILLELIKNSRIPITRLATKVKASREVATYRLNKMVEDKVIWNFVTEINITKLNYIDAALFINIKASRQKDFETHIKKSSFVSWVASHCGIWSYGLSIIGKDNKDIDKKFLELYNNFKKDIVDHRFTLHRRTQFFYEKYFGEQPKLEGKNKTKEYTADKKDKILLKELSLNSRADCVELAKKLSLSAPAVANRIRKLENSGHIEKYSIFIDISKLDLLQYSVFVVNKELDEKDKLVNYLRLHQNVSFISELVGDPYIEFGVVVKNPYELREKIQSIEESFPNNRVIEISLFQNEFVSIGSPSCIFD